MTDCEFRAAKSKIKKYINKWLVLLGLDRWTIDVQYLDQSSSTFKSDFEVLAGETHVTWFYNRALIKFYLPEFLEMEDDDVEQLVIHELTHILVNEARECGTGEFNIKFEEHVVTNLTKAFLLTYEAGVKVGKKLNAGTTNRKRSVK
jgi:hypothetical protein